MYGALDISASGLTAQRTNLDVIAGNIANMYTTRGVDGGPYRRRVAVLAEGGMAGSPGVGGVHVREILNDPSPFRLEHDPSHPDAERSGRHQGYVR